mmetsp:Transcript_68063/g.114046  ORF Transcript_68063/g.114046 Transcript_68063/m.114046 type:complete len:302 (-) Transcript_68063:379-1284(-)
MVPHESVEFCGVTRVLSSRRSGFHFFSFDPMAKSHTASSTLLQNVPSSSVGAGSSPIALDSCASRADLVLGPNTLTRSPKKRVRDAFRLSDRSATARSAMGVPSASRRSVAVRNAAIVCISNPATSSTSMTHGAAFTASSKVAASSVPRPDPETRNSRMPDSPAIARAASTLSERLGPVRSAPYCWSCGDRRNWTTSSSCSFTSSIPTKFSNLKSGTAPCGSAGLDTASGAAAVSSELVSVRSAVSAMSARAKTPPPTTLNLAKRPGSGSGLGLGLAATGGAGRRSSSLCSSQRRQFISVP